MGTGGPTPRRSPWSHTLPRSPRSAAFSCPDLAFHGGLASFPQKMYAIPVDKNILTSVQLFNTVGNEVTNVVREGRAIDI
jgi:hypothetical protein